MDIAKVINFIIVNFTFEDLLLLGLLLVLFIERKCDKIFLGLVLFIFISGFRQELLSFR
ncbi:MAG: hypothetical protein WCY24_00990 [Lutispora sp.]|nr:hypothetical protein [Lutispora sp.]MDD4833983.1 hypothetical protein [Lutispora sp.]